MRIPESDRPLIQLPEDLVEVEEDLRGLTAYWQGKGGQILSDILRYERTQMPREEMVSALDFHQDELVTNFWGTFDSLVGQAREKLGQLPTERLVELIQAIIVSGPNQKCSRGRFGLSL